MAEHRVNEEVPPERAGHRAEQSPPTDAQLLEGFITRRDEAAFAVLLQRHGPMVWTVCRRRLQHVQDAEDAFQATFLVFARKAERIQKRELLANWLYGVAYKIAARSRTMIARRQSREAPHLVVETVQAVEAKPSDVQGVLQEEVHRLPGKYRAPLVLCYLEGKSNEEAAAELRCPLGTVKGRLARAREMLRKRAVRRGVALSMAVLVTELAAQTADAMPASLAETTATAVARFAAGDALDQGYVSANVAALTEDMLKALHSAAVKRWLWFGIAAVGAVALIGVLAFLWLLPGPDDLARLQGTWRMASITTDGKTSLFDQVRWTFKDDRIIVEFQGLAQEMKLRLGEHRQPKTVDLTAVPKAGQAAAPMLGLYQLDEDTVTIALSAPGRPRPTDLSGRAGSGATLMVFRREKEP